MKIFKSSILGIVVLLSVQFAYAADTTTTSVWNRASVKVYCTFAYIVKGYDCDTNPTSQVSIIKKSGGTILSNTQPIGQTTNNGARVGNTNQSNPVGQMVNQVTNPIREVIKEVRTVVEYRGAQVGPQGPKGDTGPQGPAGSGYVSTGWIGGNYQVTPSTNPIGNNTFTGLNVFSVLPSLPLVSGALLVGNSSNIASALLPGTNNQVLAINASGTPVWTTAAALSGSTTNTLLYTTSSSTGNILVSTVNGVTATTSINSLSNVSLNGTTTVNGPILANGVGTSSLTNLNTVNLSASSTQTNTLIATLLETLTGIFQNLYASLINAGSIITGNITATGTAQFKNINASTTDTVNLNATNATTTNLSVTNLSVPNTLSLSGNIITSNIGGSIATSSVISSNAISLATSTGLLTSTVNGITATSTLGLTNGQVLFGNLNNGLSQSSNLFWDNTNARLGIGTNTPTTGIHLLNGFSSYITAEATTPGQQTLQVFRRKELI